MKKDCWAIRMQMFYFMRLWMQCLEQRQWEISENIFPDTDPKYEGASSLELLKRVGELLEEELYVVENIDATIIAQKPKMAPHIPKMRENIAKTLGLELDQINIKATTEEGLGFRGAEKAFLLRQSVLWKK